MVVASVMLSIVAVYLVRWLSMRMDMFNAGLLAAGAYLVAVTVVMAILPTVARYPRAFPPMSSTSSGWSRWEPNWCCGHPSDWSSRCW